MATGFHYVASHSDGTMERPKPTIRFTPICSIEGCEWPPQVDGMCLEHARKHLGKRFVVRVR